MDKRYVKDLKKAYRILRREKNQYKSGDEKRVELGRKMKDLKVKIEKETGGNVTDPKKQDLIDKINKLNKKSDWRAALGRNQELNGYSFEDLEFHYMKRTDQVSSKEEYRKLKGIKEELPKQEAQTIGDAAHSPMEIASRAIRVKRKTDY